MTTIYWLEQRASDAPVSNDWLGRGEAAHLARLRFPKRRDDWRLGRWTAKQTVAAYLGRPTFPADLAEIEIRSRPSGAPEVLIGRGPTTISISLSHRAGYALCAMAPSGAPLGCDVELVEQRSQVFAEDYFTAEELQLLASAPVSARERLETLIWSAKESVLKALQEGLRSSTRTVSITPVEPLESAFWQTYTARTSDGQVFQGWWRQDGTLVRTLAVASTPS